MEKVYKDNPEKEDLLAILDAIYQIGNENRVALREKVDPDDDEGVYFLGLIERATVFADDLNSILSHTRTGGYTSIYDLGGCIMDDYITMEYVLRSEKRIDEVQKINADAMRQNLQKMEELVVVNENVFGGKFPYYPTRELMVEVRERVFNRADSDKYILNKVSSSPAAMKFKRHMSMSDMAMIAGKEKDDNIARAYYFWRQWSDYVHFSSFTFNMEIENEKDITNLFKSLQEMFLHLYRVVRQTLRFFIKERAVSPVDSKGLYLLFEA